ncbi:hypothetical protein [Rubrivirga marina]|uniref:Uncharacterized protein n=1 Tax=Rubrivirga marina TaxID=1196024 RepID=A0A271ISG8_9BACT|nr:hypothetical protein [Rubrivirga marina]PAP74182.1 hypothetical protein BSZ37_21195 [Rubrivirga marina]
MPSAPHSLLELDGLLYLRSSQDDPEVAADIQRALLMPLGDLAERSDNIHFLLGLLHEARQRDETGYLQRVFLPWVAVKNRARTHAARVYSSFVGAFLDDDVAARSNELVRVYRDVVGDLFDPYATLVSASYQFIEGTFDGIEVANLGSTELGKVEYARSRIRRDNEGWDLFQHYDPVVRNAVSHAGSHGYEVHEDTVIFRNVRRSDRKVEVVRWTHDEVLQHTAGLIETVRSISLAENVFGFDCIETLMSGFDGVAALMNYAFDEDQRREMRERIDAGIPAIRAAPDMPFGEKMRRLREILDENLRVRGMTPPSAFVRSSENPTPLVLEVDDPELNRALAEAETDEAVLNAAIPLFRYNLLAQTVYGDLFEPYVTRTPRGPDGAPSRVTLETPGALLAQYDDETAGLIDLMFESAIWIDGEEARVQVDFDAWAEREDLDLGVQRFPRKPRPSLLTGASSPT